MQVKKFVKIGLFLIFIYSLIICDINLSQATRIGRGQRGEPFETDEGLFGINFYLAYEQLDIQLLTSYSSTINLSSWRITDNKDLLIDMEVLHAPSTIELWVEHMHADCFIESTSSYWDGILQDTMDDSYHGTGSPGFYIDASNSYSETFSIEGYSQFLTSYWSFYYAHVAESRRLSEERLVGDKGVYGISMMIVYDVCYRFNNSSSDHISKFIIENNIIIDLEKGFLDNTGDKEDKEETTPAFEILISLSSVIIIGIVYIKKKHRT